MVLEALEEDLTASQVVLRLVSDALTVARGEMPSNAEDLADGVLEAIDRAAELRGVSPQDLWPRLTPLDPSRPAPDFLKDLMWEIWGCFLWWREENRHLLDTDDAEAGGLELADEEEEGEDEGDDSVAALAETFLEGLASRMGHVDRNSL